MRPIKISIEGLNSFREKVTIDFEELGKQGIFGIFGKTGSGKSTILDGMTFALYGIIARHGSKYGSCINENENEAKVELEFSIMDKEPHLYKVRRSIKRKSNGDYGSAAASLIDVSGGNLPIADRAKEVTQKVEEIIGLNYDEFVKTVVLPQGSFKDFLVMEGADRRKILERIFGLEKYGRKISGVVKAEKIKVQGDIKELIGEIGGIGDITKESLEAEVKLLNEEKQNLNEFEEKSELYKKDAKEAERILEVRYKLEEAENLYAKLMEKNGEIFSLKEGQIKSEKASKVVPLIKEIGEKNAELELKRRNLDRARLLFAETEKNTEEMEENYNKAKNHHDAHYERGVERRTLLETLEKDWHKYVNIKGDRLAKAKIFEDLEKERTLAEGSLAKQEEEKLKFADELAGLEKETKSTLELIKDEGRLVEALNFYKTIVKNLSEKEEKQKVIRKLGEEIEIVKLEILRKKEELRTIKLAEKEFAVSIIKSELKKGDICPVCGKTFEEEIGDYGTGQCSVEEADALKGQMEILEIKISELTTERDTKAANMNSAQKDIERADLENLSLEKELSELYIREKWNTLEKKLEEVRVAKNKLENLEENLQILKKRIENNNDLLVESEKRKREVENNRQKLEYDLTNLKKEEETLEIGLKKDLGKVENPAIQRVEVEKALQSILDRFEKAAKNREESKAKHEEAKQNVKIEYAKLEAVEKDADKLGEKVNEAIYKYYNVDIYQLNAVEDKNELYKKIQGEYLDEAAFEKNRQLIEAYEKELTKVTVKIEELKSQQKGEIRERSELQRIIEESDEIQKKLEEHKKQIAVLENQLKNHEIAFERKKEKEEILCKLEKRGELLDTLAKLFEASKFAEYMAIENLKYISMQAGNTLKTISGGKYSLIADDDGTFKIQDFKNGGVIRSVKTMSGGETFVVSLSLALALSAQLQLKGRAPIELFFLDEGFGTLDEELLDVVMDSLEKLANDRFKIGIVSHVEQLKQRMPIRLTVTPQEIGRGGSKVKIEYN